MVWSYFDDFFRINGNKKKMNKAVLILPIIFVIAISIFLFIFLLQEKDPNKPPSALLNEDLPKFKMIDLFNEKKFITNKDLESKITLVNFFASWCAPCKVEHPLFFSIKKKYPDIIILGIDMQDKKKDAIQFLKTDGNPYDYVGIDKDGFIGIEFGVLGLPETFLVNESGKIVYKYLGPLTKEIIKSVWSH